MPGIVAETARVKPLSGASYCFSARLIRGWRLNHGITHPMIDRKTEHFTEKETQQRFEAALRGAKIAGAQHKESVTPKKAKPQRKKRRTKP